MTRSMMPVAMLLAAAAIAYVPSLGGAFQFDDYNVIVGNPVVHSWRAWFGDFGGGIRPALKASYTLNWVSGFGETGFHLFNIAVHMLNAVLVYRIGSRLVERWLGEQCAARHMSAVFVAALVFALHPVQTEAVTYISGRSVSLMAVFYLGALLMYLRGAHWSVSAGLFALAAATRETALTLPFALLLCELVQSRPPGWREIVRRQWAHWTLLSAALLAGLTHARYHDLISYGFSQRGIGDNLLSQIGGVGYLLARLAFPVGLNIDPALPVLHEWNTALVAQAASLLGLFCLGLANLRKRPWIAFGVLWFCLQLAPTNSLVPRLDVANERQLYLACWGLFLALCIQCVMLESKVALLRAATAALLVILGTLSMSRQLDYASEIALWQASVLAAPGNARGHNNLGYAHALAGDHARAVESFGTALELRPDYAKAKANLADSRSALLKR